MLFISIKTQFIGDVQANFLATIDFSCLYYLDFNSTTLWVTIIDKSIGVSSLVYIRFQIKLNIFIPHRQ